MGEEGVQRQSRHVGSHLVANWVTGGVRRIKRGLGAQKGLAQWATGTGAARGKMVGRVG